MELLNILKYLNNYFYKFREDNSNFKIENNKIKVKGKYIPGQYIRIYNSYLNDGIFQVIGVEDGAITIEGGINEEFDGVIFSLSIPRDILKLSEKVKEYNQKNVNNGIISESFEGYSYTKATNNNGELVQWHDAFKSELAPYKKMRDRKDCVKSI